MTPAVPVCERLSGVSQLYLAPSWPFLRRAETNCLYCVKCCEHIAPPIPFPRLDLKLCWSGGCRVAPSAEYLAKQSAEAPPETLLLPACFTACCYCCCFCCCCCRRAVPQSDDIICGPREIYLCLCESLCMCVGVCERECRLCVASAARQTQIKSASKVFAPRATLHRWVTSPLALSLLSCIFNQP